MGQVDSKKKIEQEFQIYKLQRDGNMLLKNKKDGKEYLMRVVSCSTQADINRLKALLECRAQLKNHHILSLVQIKEKQQDMICSISYKMYLILQYSFKNLAVQVKERSTEHNHFQESDIWSILYSCSTALNALYSNGATHQSLTAQQIFINKDGFVKITQPLLFGLQKNHLEAMKTKDQSNTVNVHLSPEIIACLDDQNFFYYDKEKSDIFILAMVIIDIALLSNHYLYDSNKRPIPQEIEQLLTQVGQRYSNNLVNILGEMLRMEARLRPNLTQIIDKIQKCNSVGQDFAVQIQSNLKSHQSQQRQQQRNNLEKTNRYKQDFAFEEKKKIGNIHIHTNISAQDQSLMIKQPTNMISNQNFDGKVFVTTPSASHFTARQVTYQPNNYYQHPNNVVVHHQQQPQIQQNHHFINIQQTQQQMQQIQQPQQMQQMLPQTQQVQQTQQNFPINYQPQPPNIRPQQQTNYQSIPILQSQPIIYISPQQIKSQQTNIIKTQQIKYQPNIIKSQQINYQKTVTVAKPEPNSLQAANFIKTDRINYQQATIPHNNIQNFNIYERSRSIDSIKANSNNEFDQIKGITARTAIPYNVQTKRNQLQIGIKSKKQPLFSHQIPQVYNIIMNSKNSTFKAQNYNKKDTIQEIQRPFYQPQQQIQQKQQFTKYNNFSHLKNFNKQVVSRSGEEPQSPSFQTIELKKNISHTQSQRKSPAKFQIQENRIQNFAQNMNNFNNVSIGAYKPNPFSISTPGNYNFSSSAAGGKNETSSPIVSSSFIPSMPLSPQKGQSFTCRSGFSHLALFHKQDQQLKLQFVKEQLSQRGRYEGYKCDGEKNGHGILYFKDGGYYQGQWKHDKMHGFGRLYYENGKTAYEGHWQNDEFNGQGRVYNSQPLSFEQEFNYKDLNEIENKWIYYEGQFKNDSKHGKGYIKLSNGEMFQGIFQNDKVQGNGIFYKRTGEIIIGFWIDSKLFLNQSYQHDKK